MNWDQVEGSWQDFKGKFRSKWGKLTDDDYEQIAGRKDQLVGKLQELYGEKKEKIELELDRWMKNLRASKEGEETSHKHLM